MDAGILFVVCVIGIPFIVIGAIVAFMLLLGYVAGIIDKQERDAWKNRGK